MLAKNVPGLSVTELELHVLDRISVVEHVAMAPVAAILALNAASWAIPDLFSTIHREWRPMSYGESLAALYALVSLYCSGPDHGKRMVILSRTLAMMLAFGCGSVLVADLIVGAGKFAAGQQLVFPGGFEPQSAAAFALIGVSLLIAKAHKRVESRVADSVIFLLVLLVLTIISAKVMGAIKFFGPVTDPGIPTQSLVCLSLLTAAVFLRRSQRGAFSLLFGRSIGSRIARSICPVLLLLPYFREGIRAHFISAGRMPAHYTTAILASLAASISLALALYIGLRFNVLEAEIQGLSLRDPLTGLYNLRGFRLLAEQSLLLAYRSRQPFSVLYVDVDDLKLANDQLGHQAGSDFLLETAAILRGTFRETDTIARIGGDEFAVAGQFSKSAIEYATDRLKAAVVKQNEKGNRTVPLGLSVGHVTTKTGRRESLDLLLALADEAMYQEKRRRKGMALVKQQAKA